MKPIALCLCLFAGLLGSSFAQDNPLPLEFDTGRPRPPKAGMPVMGSGLAMSEGYYRGVPKGELAGWTVSLWFQPNSEAKGEIFNIVLGEKNGTALRLEYEAGALHFTGPAQGKRPGWKIGAQEGATPGKWHHAAISYGQADGPALYLDGKHIDQGQRGWMGYATLFDNYHFGVGIQDKGQLGNFFDGLIDDFFLYERPFSEEEIVGLFNGAEVWDSLVAFNDFENVSHQDFVQFTASDRDEKYLDEGKTLYEINCVQCHSKDGKAPPINPLSRMFTKHEMENGGDPFSMFRTLTYGFRNMMPAVQLNPEDRYKVIHYLREKIIKENSPELYVSVSDGYTDVMPQNPEGLGEEVAQTQALARTGYLRGFGNALISPVRGRAERNNSHNALTIDLGNETTISYDLGTMRSIGAWRGGFLNFENTLHHKLRAPALPGAGAFELLPGSDQWHWAWQGKAESEVPNRGPLTVWPEEQVRYNGHYPYGKEIVISYSVQGRSVLESPLGSEDGIHRRFTIGKGETALEVVALSSPGQVPQIDGRRASVEGKTWWVMGSDSAKWRATDSGELVLHIPGSETSTDIDVVLAYDSQTEPENLALDLTQRTQGSPSRWEKTPTMKGKLAVSSFQGYALDSVPVPLKNPYNTWMRTSCLTFFPDGRLAVGTLSGDIWMVSGLDESLQEVTWRRFAAGLYEPMGMKVVDGVLTVGTRGRIVKLHDLNDDGEADFYEAFFNEPEPDPGWHAYSFDLEVGEDGSYYYARVGGFSDWSVPGGMVRVDPDGKGWEVYGAGMRVPNGIGLLPDGRVTFSDNQGTYVPASKISITRPGDFHGAGKWPAREGKYDPERIVPPIIYMPQELDSSSGSQLWVEKDERLGPLSGHYFHASYGRARLIYLMLDEREGRKMQAAAYPLPLTMESGTLRIAKNPVDGQLYTSGLTGWQAGATREGSIQRLRYNDDGGIYLVDAKARDRQLELSFNRPVDPASVANLKAWSAEAWNYRWSQQYGSPHLKVSDPGTEGADAWKIASVELSEEGRKLTVRIPDLQPCHTLKLEFEVAGRDGGQLGGPLYFTIHGSPDAIMSKPTSPITELERRASEGDLRAALSLGMRYRDGNGVARDYEKALKWYRQSADANDPQGLDNVGYMYLRGWGIQQNSETAVEFFKAGAEGGNPQAAYNWGECYFSGQGVTQNYARAMEIWEEAAAAGYQGAKWRLAMMYAAGEGGPQDLKKAKALCREIVEKGHLNAMLLLGEILYKDGAYDDARQWWKRAAEGKSRQGNALLELSEWRNQEPQAGVRSFVEVDHIYQGWNNCGATSMSMFLRQAGSGLSPYDVKRFCPQSPIGTGTDWAHLVEVAPKAEQDWKMVVFSYDDSGFEEGLGEIRKHLDEQRPVVIDFTVKRNENGKIEHYGHTLLVVGYDLESERFVLKNPNQPSPGIELMSAEELKENWYSKGYSKSAKGKTARPLIVHSAE